MATAHAVYATRLTEHLSVTPEGYLHFRNAVIGRTGTQRYKGRELPQRQEDTPSEELTAQDLGIGPDEDVELWRPSDEVFAPHTVASFQHKVITDNHPSDLVNIETHAEHDRGHIFNVRPGTIPLDSGDLPLLADGIITDSDLKAKVLSGIRDLSCGYNYRIAKDATGRLLQIDLTGNHVAVVPNGRAGNAAIFDSATGRVIDKPERKPIKLWGTNPMAGLKEKFMALGFKAWAADAAPEEVEKAMDEMTSHPADCDCVACKGVAKDEIKEEAKAQDSDIKGSPEPVVKFEGNAADENKDEERISAHNALDRYIDRKRAKDAELTKKSTEEDAQLKRLFSATDSDIEENEPMANDAEEKDPKEVEEEEEKGAKASDEDSDTPVIEPIDRSFSPVPAAVDAAALDRAVLKGVAHVLKELKPVIALSNDSKVHKAFDSVVRSYQTGRKNIGQGGYKAVQQAAVAHDGVKDAPLDLAKIASEAYAKQSESMNQIPGGIKIR